MSIFILCVIYKHIYDGWMMDEIKGFVVLAIIGWWMVG